MNEEFIPAPPYIVPEEYHLPIKGIEFAIRSAAIAMHIDFGGKVEDHESKLKLELTLHLFAGESIIREYDG